MRNINIPKVASREEYAALIMFFNSVLSLLLSYAATKFSNSLTIENDMISYFVDITYYAAITGLIFKMKNDNEYNFNYSTGKIQAAISFTTGMLLFLYIFYVGFAVYDQYAQMVPFEASHSVLVLYIIMMVKNVLALYLVNKIIGPQKSLIIESGNIYAISCVIDNIITLIPFAVFMLYTTDIVAVFIYVDIACSLVLGLSNLYFVFPMLRTSTNELLDRALEEETMLQIMRVLAKHFDQYDDLVSLRSRETGGTKYIELYMAFNGDLKYAEVLVNMADIKASLETEIPRTVAKIIPVLPETQ